MGTREAANAYRTNTYGAQSGMATRNRHNRQNRCNDEIQIRCNSRSNASMFSDPPGWMVGLSVRRVQRVPRHGCAQDADLRLLCQVD